MSCPIYDTNKVPWDLVALFILIHTGLKYTAMNINIYNMFDNSKSISSGWFWFPRLVTKTLYAACRPNVISLRFPRFLSAPSPSLFHGVIEYSSIGGRPWDENNKSIIMMRPCISHQYMPWQTHLQSFGCCQKYESVFVTAVETMSIISHFTTDNSEIYSILRTVRWYLYLYNGYDTSTYITDMIPLPI